MTETNEQQAGRSWSSNWGFLFASIGVAVGLGNLWRFPFLAGENGGSAFVLVYLACVAFLGAPLIAAELVIGRRGGKSPVGTMRELVRAKGASSVWTLIGWLSLLVPFFGLTYYNVVAGWTLQYLLDSVTSGFAGFDAARSQAANAALVSSPLRLTFWHTVFVGFTVLVVSLGIRKGLERVTRFMMPGLFFLLLVLVVYAAFAGRFAAGVEFLFAPRFDELSASVFLQALGQAFFSLAVGVGALITYAAYLPRSTDLPRYAAVIAVADTAVAILAGLAIFPIVFAAGLPADSGPNLLFVTVPVAFGGMPMGAFFAPLFFLLLIFAAFTSTIGMLEPIVSWVEEHRGWSRPLSAGLIGGLAWFCGLSAVLSFNLWSDVRPLAFVPGFEDRDIFGTLDFLTANVMIPVNALLIAFFAGWVLSRADIQGELQMKAGAAYEYWAFAVRYVAPVAIVLILYSVIFGG